MLVIWVFLWSILVTGIESREWHIASLYGDKNEWSSKLYYPKYHQCSNNDDLRLQLDYTSEDVSNWSTILNQELFYLSTVPDSYAEELILDNLYNQERGIIILRTLVSIFFIDTLIALLSLIFMPIVGAIGVFLFGGLTFVLIKVVQVAGRYVIMLYERLKWKRGRLVLPKSAKKLHADSKHYKIPYFFRPDSDHEMSKTFDNKSSEESNSTEEEEQEEERLVAELENKVRLRKLSVSLKTLQVKNQIEQDFGSMGYPTVKQGGKEKLKARGNSITFAEMKQHEMKPQRTIQRPDESEERFQYVMKKHSERPLAAGLGRKRRRKVHALDPDITQVKQNPILQEKTRDFKLQQKKLKKKGKAGKTSGGNKTENVQGRNKESEIPQEEKVVKEKVKKSPKPKKKSKNNNNAVLKSEDDEPKENK